MDISKVSVGKNAPHDINVVVEVPLNSGIKYELDKDSGAIEVDRILHTPMHYPCNYGFIPCTLSDDGDPADVLVAGHQPILPGAIVRCRPVGVLIMEDEAGQDEKILAIPVTKLDPTYAEIEEYTDLPKNLIDQIGHFFEHYKDLEKGKWVKVVGWDGAQKAKEMIQTAIDQAKK